MGIIVGTTSVRVVPSAETFWADFVRQTGPEARQVGKRIGDELANGLNKSFQDGARKGAEESAGTFGRTFKARLKAALASLPDVQINANSTDAEVKIAQLKQRLRDLHDAKIGVTTNAGTVLVELREVEAELRHIGEQSPQASIRIDTLGAATQLAEFDRLLDKTDGRNVHADVEVDTAAARAEMAALTGETDRFGNSVQVQTGHLTGLLAAGISLGPALLPVLAALAAAAGGLALPIAAATSAAVAFGFGFVGIPAAIKAMADAQDAEAKSAGQLAVRQKQISAAVDGVANANRSLALARQNAADSVINAEQRVQSAQTQQLRAVEDLRRAQLGLNEARLQARDALRALQAQIEGGALAERQGVLDVQNALQRLNATKSDVTATTLQRQQAQLTYDREVFQLKETRRRNIELRDEQKKSVKAGVEGSTQVVAAKDRIKTAEERVRDAELAVDSARRAQVSAARQGSAAIASATAGVTAANRTLEAQMAKTGTTGAAAIDKVTVAMANLSPAGRSFAKFLFSLKPELQSIRAVAQQNLLPGLEQGIRAILSHAEPFKAFIGSMAQASGEGFVSIVKSMESPAWQKFLSFVKNNAVDSFRQWLQIVLNLSNGIIGIINQFTPFTQSVTSGLLKMSKSFSDFGDAPENHPGFQNFLKFVRDSIPTVIQFVQSLVGAVGHLVAAAAPVGVGILQGFTGLFEVIRKIPTPVLTVLIGLITGVTGALKIMSITQKAYEAVAGGMKNVTRLFVAQRAAVDGVTASTKTATGAQLGLNAAVLSNPIGLVIGVALGTLAAMAGLFLLAWKNSAFFRDQIRNIIVDISTTFTNLKNLVSGVSSSMGISFGAFFDGWIRHSEIMIRGLGNITGAIADLTSKSLGLEGTNARIAASQRGVQQATKDVAKAEQDLQVARQTAADQLLDLDSQVKQSGIDRRQAILDEAKARKDLDAVLKDPKASEAQREQARLTWEQAQLRLDDTIRREKGLQAEQKNTTEKGIENNNQVKQAEENRHKAQEILDQKKAALAANEKRRTDQLKGDTLLAYAIIRGTVANVYHFFEGETTRVWGVINAAYDNGAAKVQIALGLWDGAVAGTRRGMELLGNAVTTVMRSAFKVISDTWNLKIKPIFVGIGNMIMITLPQRFDAGISAIGEVFGKLREIAKSPIDFVVRTVINTGLIGKFNEFIRNAHLPNSLGIPPVKWPPPGWAEGGEVPAWMGTAGRDSVHALLMPNEHVWTPREVAGAGGHGNVARLRQAAAQGRLPRFAGGGPVGGAGGGTTAGAYFTMPMNGRFTSGYGMRNGKLHDGQDIAAPINTPIKAAFPGRVWKSGFSGGWGNQVILSHGMYQGKPLFTRYAHMNSIAAAKGQTVGGGQVIGREGSTGQSTGPHLHFGVYRGNSPNYGTSVPPSSIFHAFAGSGVGAGNVSDLIGSKFASMFKGVEGTANSFGNIGKAALGFSRRMGSELMKKVPSLIGDGIVDALGNIINIPMPGASEGAWVDARALGPNVVRWESTMASALKALHQSPGALLPGMLRRLKQESGGNPSAINLWDSNARKGTPSKGLMQVIDPTFNAHAGPYRQRGIYDPFANIYAGLHYALRRYGDLRRIDPQFPGGLGFRGYDSGGYLPPGLTMTYNGTNKPERVFTEPQWKTMEKLAFTGGSGGGNFSGNLYLDSGELLGKVQGIVHKEIDDSMDYLSNNRIYGYEGS